MAQTFTHDLIVVGAGPSGAAAAMEACKAGLRVALIDKAAFPRDKLCGGGITGRALGYIEAVFGPLPADLLHACGQVRMVAGAQEICVLTDARTPSMTMRLALDGYLRGRAIAAGAEDFCGNRIADLDLGRGVVRLADGLQVSAPIIVGADGVNSQVARLLYGRAHDPARVGFALEAEVSGPSSQTMELDLTAAPWGYGWDFPKASGRTLGIGGLAVHNGDLKPRFEAWLRAKGIEPATVTIKGHHLPFGEFREAPGKDHVLLAGDAAGLVDPITGEGIGWAIRSGQLAGQAADAALRMNTPNRALALYQASMSDVLRELRRARMLSKLVYHPFMQHRFLRVLARSTRLQSRYMSLMAGEMDYADVHLGRVLRIGFRILTGRGG
ncbi:MAG: geranylgeranyl reductase family protein [Rhodobacteraceae bacterium]|nr:geranylgeranyl reductase family protein [Paracoccaceae bacterium]MCF8514968.1 geranylgeranyl reductase family protein [Paracoccaceae bacterium]MCF8519212.1 geranylgeranyl reductase family protein [Paracoccaceae bacterium]